MGKDPESGFQSNTLIKKGIKDCQRNLKETGDNWACTSINESVPVGKRMLTMMKKSFEPMYLTRLILPDTDWRGKVYGVRVQIHSKGFSNVMPTHMACAECRMILKGSSVIAGASISDIPGETMKEKRRALQVMTIDDIEAVLRRPSGWLIAARKGQSIIIPSGAMVMEASNEEVEFVKWAVSGDAHDSTRVKNALTNILAEHKELRAPSTGYSQFLEFLTDNA